MKKKTKLIIIGAAMTLVAVGIAAALLHNQYPDKCTAQDRQQNNCVPAGRCTPPGDPREATVDCALKNYDHKFKQ